MISVRNPSLPALAIVNAITSLLASMGGFVLVGAWAGADRIGLLALVGAVLFPLRFVDLGLGAAIARDLAAHRQGCLRRRAGRIVPAALALSVFALGVAVVVCLAIAPPLLAKTVPAADLIEARSLAGYVVAAALIQQGGGILNAVTIGSGQFRQAYMGGILASLLQLAALVPLVLLLGVAALPVGQAVAFGVLAINGLVALRRIPRGEGPADADVSLRNFFGVSGQFTVFGAVGGLLEPAAKLLLGLAAPLLVVGCYEILWRAFVQIRTIAVAPLEPAGYGVVRSAAQDPARNRAGYARLFVLSWLGAAALLLTSLPLLAMLVWLVPSLAGAPGVPIALAVGTVFALSFGTVAIHFRALASGTVLPQIAGTVVNLTVQGAAYLAAAEALGWQGALAAIVCGYAAGVAVQYALLARFTGHAAIPGAGELKAAVAQIAGAGRQALRRLGGAAQ